MATARHNLETLNLSCFENFNQLENFWRRKLLCVSMEKQFSAIASEHYRFSSALHSQFFALALAAHLSFPFRHQIFYKRMYHKTEKSTEKEGKRGEQNKFNGDTNLLSLIFLVYYFLPFTLFFPPFGFLFCLPTFLDLHKNFFFCRVKKWLASPSRTLWHIFLVKPAFKSFLCLFTRHDLFLKVWLIILVYRLWSKTYFNANILLWGGASRYNRLYAFKNLLA